MLGPELELKLNIPEQNLGSLSFTEATPEAIGAWVAELPMANLGETSRLVFKAINELNRLECSTDARAKMLELLRSPIHYACNELSKHFLNSSVTPQEKQRKIINLVQSLQVQLATGYKIILVQSVPSLSSEATRQNFSFAAHRLISEFGRLMLVCSQLYIQVPKTVWHDLNEAYRFSDELGLMKYLIRDDSNNGDNKTSVDIAFKRNLLLACCRPNQLRQQEIKAAWEAFEVWANYVELGRKYASTSVFCINLADDAPPKYRSLIQENLDEHYYGFDTTELNTRITSHLSEHGKAQDSGITHLELPIRMSATLLHHLHQSLSLLTKRTFKRIASDGALNVAVGLSAIHFYTSGKTAFQPHLFGIEDLTFNSPEATARKTQNNSDPWAHAFDAASISNAKSIPSDSVIDYTSHAESAEKDFPVHTTDLINTSPGGYCIQWDGLIPKNVQAGELLCVREEEDKTWSIAVIRWMRYSKQKGTQIGIELLAPRAKPCAIQQLNKTGKHSEFLRGLLLPELSSIGQPSTLLTPRLPFQKGNKVVLRFSGIETKCILSDVVAETGSFNQFILSTTTVLDSKTEDLEPEVSNVSAEDEFDSLWPSL